MYTVGVIAVLVFYVTVPIKFFFIDNVKIPLMPIQILFCDQSTLSGFLAANSLMGIMGIISGIATIMYGSGFLICICNYVYQVDLIGQDVKDLDEMWDGSSTTSVAYRHAFLCNVCRKLEDMKRYDFDIFLL